MGQQRQRRSWNNLPHDLLCFIHNKKLYSTDRIRFRAVCRSWRIPKDDTKSEYPWLLRRQLQIALQDRNSSKYSYMFELVDPYNCLRTYERSKPIDKSLVYEPYDHLAHSDLFASMYGWRLLHGNDYGYSCDRKSLSLFFHNPFNNQLILLPTLSLPFDYEFFQNPGTFTTVPTSPDCEVLVLVQDAHVLMGPLYIARYCLTDNEKGWTTQLLDEEPCCHFSFSVHYTDGKLYCFFSEDGTLKCYNLVDKSWKLITSYSPCEDDEDNWFDRLEPACRLTGISGRLALVGKICEPKADRRSPDWMIFKFDWSRMRWVNVGEKLKNITIFVCRRFIHVQENDDDDDCKIIHFRSDWSCRRSRCEDLFTCFSFKNGRNIGIPEPYTWINAKTRNFWRDSICFVQPPLPTT